MRVLIKTKEIKNHLRHIVMGVFCICTYSLVQAQDGEEVFSPYVSLGLSSAQISGDRLSGFEQLGLTGGLGVKVGASEKWQPAMEILFTQKGSRKNARPDEGDFSSYLLRLNYAELPLLVHYNTGNTGFHLGLSPGYLISAREENEFGEIVGLGREFKTFDLNALLGIQYRFHERWELVTRYNQSIIPVRDHAGNSSFRLNRGQYNSSIQFLIRFSV